MSTSAHALQTEREHDRTFPDPAIREPDRSGPGTRPIDWQVFPGIPARAWRHPVATSWWGVRSAFSCLFLLAILALGAAIPVANIFVLGYLMEIQGRVARTGKFRSAFFLLPAAQRLGVVVLAVGLWLLPIHFLAGMTRDSWLLVPAGTTPWFWTALLTAASSLIAMHLLLSIGRGGRLSYFVRPVSNLRWLLGHRSFGESWQSAQDALGRFFAAFEAGRLFSLGLLGYATAYAFLLLPAWLFTRLNDVTSPWQVGWFLLGGGILTLLLMWMPLWLAHVAAEGRVGAIAEAGTVRRLAGQSPFCWMLASLLLFAVSALPLLYHALIKNQIPPHVAVWDVMVVFLVTVVPARVLVGWVYHRAKQRPRSASSWWWRAWQGMNGLLLAGGTGFYVYFLYLAQTGGDLGQRAVWQFHALLLPWPW